MDKLVRNKVWIGLGIVTLVVAVLFVLGPCSLMGENARRFEALQDRAEELRRHARKKVKNEKWVEQQQRIKKRLESQLRQIQEELLSRDSLLEEHIQDPETNSPGPLSFGRFPAAYEKAMDDLLTKLEGNVIEISSDSPLVRKELGSEWLTQEVLHSYEKQFQVQKAIVNAIADLNGEADVVPVFDSFRFREKPQRLLSQAHNEYFDTIPFVLKVAMEFEFYPLFLERVMSISMGPEVTSVQMRRYVEGKSNQVKSASRKRREESVDAEENVSVETPEERSIPQDLVFVTLNGYIPDYKKQDEESEDSESDSGDRRRRRR